MNNSRNAALMGAGIVVLAALVIAVLVMAGGLYNVAADSPHTALVGDLIAYTRERSIDVRSEGIKVPALTDPKMIADGASDYDAMCTACHLAPGLKENEMRPGMNPKPPILANVVGEPAEQFWTIKHGIKMTGMPAWGVTHSDAEIWNMVAFLQKLPKLTPPQYRALVASAQGHHDEDHMDMSSH
jgi:mono/diheme cytochrome c family protein